MLYNVDKLKTLIKHLRSGKYKEVDNRKKMYEINEKGEITNYCFAGLVLRLPVIEKIVKENEFDPNNENYFINQQAMDKASDYLRPILRFYLLEGNRLYDQCIALFLDENKSFKEIADFIEKNLKNNKITDKYKGRG